MVSVRGISKRYGAVQAVADVHFDVARGELFGLIGPDGAGKTSLLRIITTVLLADDGAASVDGHDVVRDYRTIRSMVGYMPGRFSLYQDLSVQENLDFFATLFGTTVEENYDLIRDIYVQLEPFKQRRAGNLSGGMKQKLALCCALIHSPTLLVLDEPTTGVDPVSRKEFWAMLRRFKEQGITTIVSTPYMDEARLCDRIALMQHGRIMQTATPDEIVAGFTTALFAARSANMYALHLDLLAHRNVESCYTFGEYLHVTLIDSSQGAVQTLSDNLLQRHPEFELISMEPTVEDCFIRMTNGVS
ncbi:MAG: ABC transporter ATP-binding protein [Candidatus Kapabacteria bacterium]|nr:ABC transporter ATP-binding protein [Candidatus Kapabacteria bacterium]